MEAVMVTLNIAPIPQDAGLWSTIVESLPSDPAAIFVLFLVAIGAVAVWLANRGSD
jgi:hypothetical protein